jgi:hypothetical protein
MGITPTHCIAAILVGKPSSYRLSLRRIVPAVAHRARPIPLGNM